MEKNVQCTVKDGKATEYGREVRVFPTSLHHHLLPGLLGPWIDAADVSLGNFFQVFIFILL